jgi:hypothetical protein
MWLNLCAATSAIARVGFPHGSCLAAVIGKGDVIPACPLLKGDIWRFQTADIEIFRDSETRPVAC